MLHLVTLICILSGVLTSGYCLSCIQCMSNKSTQCSGPSVPCPSDEHSCLSAYGLTTMGNKEVGKAFIRMCQNRTFCNQFGSIGFSIGRIKSSTTCCSTDNCTPPIPTFQNEVHQKNGVTCQTCISTNTNSCVPMETMACTGSENKCITQITDVSGSKTALRGCSTELICDGIQNIELGNFTYSAQVSCTDGDTRLQLSILTLIFSGFINVNIPNLSLLYT
uniref:UPAR/Ly6 domain-containing protein n=1 Tax=Leptobrachium leishanense TaxID=445787 RepID=A0A8C5WDH1_9ANUR